MQFSKLLNMVLINLATKIKLLYFFFYMRSTFPLIPANWFFSAVQKKQPANIRIYSSDTGCSFTLGNNI